MHVHAELISPDYFRETYEGTSVDWEADTPAKAHLGQSDSGNSHWRMCRCHLERGPDDRPNNASANMITNTPTTINHGGKPSV